MKHSLHYRGALIEATYDHVGSRSEGWGATWSLPGVGTGQTDSFLTDAASAIAVAKGQIDHRLEDAPEPRSSREEVVIKWVPDSDGKYRPWDITIVTAPTYAQGELPIILHFDGRIDRPPSDR